jgi:DNA replication and repair protein RecF
MQLVHLSLTNFRNFIRLEMEFPPGPTLVVGPNAQGKTSLLEAIDYLVDAESPRAGNDRELINFLVARQPDAFARVVAEIRRGDRPSHSASYPVGDRGGDRASSRSAARRAPEGAPGSGSPAGERLQRIEIRLVAESPNARGESNAVRGGEGRLQKEILLNGVRRRALDLAGSLNAVLFLPDDLRIIEGPPSERRRLLDRTLSQADAAYARALAEYGRVLTQRNALLRQGQDRPFDARQLDPWDVQLVDLGTQLSRGRAMALAELERLAIPIHEALTRGGEQLRLAYLPSRLGRSSEGQLRLPLEAAVDWSTLPAAAIADELRRALAEARGDEIERGMTLVGPHRDDIRFLADGVDLRPYGSRGQNRTAMISVRLAEAEWIHQRTAEWPVLLLDETLAELDEARRRDVLERIALAPQAVLTAADLNLFPASFCRSAVVWELRGGTPNRAAPRA